MTRLALEVSGQARFGDYFPDQLRTLSGTFDHIDVYVWVWKYKDGFDLGSYMANAVRDLPNVSIKALVLADQIDFVPAPGWQLLIWCGSPIKNMMSMTYAIKQCAFIRQQVTEPYDLVMRTRPDLKLEYLSEAVLKAVDGQSVFVGDRPIYLIDRSQCGPAWPHTLQDQVAIGAPVVMDRYAMLFDHFNDYHSEVGAFHPEKLFYWWLVTKCGFTVFEAGMNPVLERKVIS